MTNVALEELARGIAIGGHAGQLDKAGKPYVSHPMRVVASLTDFESRVLAWLHDVVEDTPVTLEDLARAGFPESIVLQVDALTHRPNEPLTRYYERILPWPAARRVKLEDIADNSCEERLYYLDSATQLRLRKKYKFAREVLGGVR